MPCIATRTGSIGELIDARCGVLVEQRNPRALADAIEGLLNDGETRRALVSSAGSRRARFRRRSNFSRGGYWLGQVQDSAAMRRWIAELTSARS